ncbi:zinc-binding dehydrogenase [Nakamurella sp. YIM 132087]|uniref:Zinc-binding dehydrogenase n=1 Tax=Nakamurella alba TaxID=2665158 RepID=A0A7K1FEF1_9ACTN|nr:NADPH:quinone oxidoreductase family protein [Nakamurella alba]MTD12456.1 zinc-binding dehydrogenase [Nakamurella alba]
MKAFVVEHLTGPAGGTVRDVPEPVGAHPWARGERLLVDVRAAGVSFPDLLQSRGEYQHGMPVPYVAGGEIAGVVLEAAEGSRFSPGDRVAGVTVWGGLAERAVVIPHFAARIPDHFSWAQGAAFVLNYSTAWFALYRVGARAGETVVVQGASGGVGTATVQVARALGMVPIAVVSDDRKEAAVRTAGAQLVIRPEPGWHSVVRELTGGVGADIVVDPVGGDRFTDSLRCLGVGGRLAVVGFAGGGIPTVRANRLLLRDLSVVGVALAPYLERYPAVAGEMIMALEDLAERGEIRPLVGHELPLSAGAEALALLDRREAVGKVVVGVR